MKVSIAVLTTKVSEAGLKEIFGAVTPAETMLISKVVVEVTEPDIAVTVYVTTPDVPVGVPVICPVEVLKFKPAGSEGEIDQEVTDPPLVVGVFVSMIWFCVSTKALP